MYRIARDDDWVMRRAKVRSAAALDGETYEEAVEAARAEVRSKVHERLAELEALCQAGKHKAILSWLQMAGMFEKSEGPSEQPSIGVINDLRQIHINQNPETKDSLDLPDTAPRELENDPSTSNQL